jgi:signal transduction histidine kinase
VNHAAARILVVDDDAAGRYLKAHILRKQGYQVIEAATGSAAIEQCCIYVPDLVLVDVVLPDANGVDISRQIKAANPGIAVLQTSAAVTNALDRAIALDGGADGFLVEPIEPSELLAASHALLRLRRAEQEVRKLNESLEQQIAERTRKLTEANRQLQAEIEERRKTEDVLWHTQRLEAVGQLTGGIAHDFNNLLAVIVGSMEMIRNVFESDAEPQRARILRLLKACETATGRATKLTQQLLTFARRSTFKLDVVSLDEVLVACEPFLRRALGEAHTLELNFGADLWPCHIDAAQFEAAILNLVVNARDAMPSGGRLEIDTSNVIVDIADPQRPSDLSPGAYVMLRVTDTGVGMEPDVAARAFEPFFTTKEVGRGTGLGLSQVYGFIKQSGGHVAIDTAPGMGTTFRLYLPRCDVKPSIGYADTRPIKTAPTGHETVLVVEDNAEVRELAVNTIGELGYRVLTAVDGPTALEIVRGDEPIDLLFSDIVMPNGMNGFELISKAQSIREGLKVLLTSGYSNLHRPGADRPDVPLLAKPYRRIDLAQCIRRALD